MLAAVVNQYSKKTTSYHTIKYPIYFSFLWSLFKDSPSSSTFTPNIGTESDERIVLPSMLTPVGATTILFSCKLCSFTISYNLPRIALIRVLRSILVVTNCLLDEAFCLFNFRISQQTFVNPVVISINITGTKVI
ncbi:unnamed protein product [Rhizophagus irregularis]|nr:unnamed protein product [Rhizophagus irregularis]